MEILKKDHRTGEYIPMPYLIAQMIAKSGLSKKEACKRAGFARSTLTNWENGESLRTINLLRQLADVCEAEKPCEAMQAFENPKTIYIIVGAAESGKSRLAQDLAKKHRLPMRVDLLSTRACLYALYIAGFKMYIKRERPDGIIIEVYQESEAEEIIQIAMSAGYRAQYCYTLKTDKGFKVEYNPPMPC